MKVIVKHEITHLKYIQTDGFYIVVLRKPKWIYLKFWIKLNVFLMFVCSYSYTLLAKRCTVRLIQNKYEEVLIMFLALVLNIVVSNFINESFFIKTCLQKGIIKSGHVWHKVLNPCSKKQASSQSCDLVDSIVAGQHAECKKHCKFSRKKSCLLQCLTRNPVFFLKRWTVVLNASLCQSCLSLSSHYSLSSLCCTDRVSVKRPTIR